MKNTLEGKWVIDTQVLIYGLDAKSSFHRAARSIFQTLILNKNYLVGFIAQQNILEAENVLIKQYKQPYKEAIRSIENIIVHFGLQIIAPLPNTYLNYHAMVMRMDKKTADIFDVFLAATILDNGITNIITANEKDFTDIKEISVYNPFFDKRKN